MVIIIFALLFLSIIYYVFIKNKIQKKNRLLDIKGGNPFKNWTDDEYKSLFYNPESYSKKKFKGFPDTIDFVKLNPKELQNIHKKYIDNFNWADDNNMFKKSIISPVKRQGFCGSCYAFSFIEVIQSVYYLSKFCEGPLIELSVQQIIDCTSSDPNDPILKRPSKGCEGGDFIYIMNTYLPELYFPFPRRIITDNDYPYVCFYKTYKNSPPKIYDGSVAIQLEKYNFVDGDKRCDEIKPDLNYVTINSMISILIEDEKYLKEAIYTYGPVKIGFLGGYDKDHDTNNFSFKNYMKDWPMRDPKYVSEAGVYIYKPNVYDLKLAHAMVITGWGKDTNTNETFWIVKNSWGTSWGINGYVRFPMYKNFFINMVTAKFIRPNCDSIFTIISLATRPIYSVSKSKYIAPIYFKAYKKYKENKIKLLIKTFSFDPKKSSILPKYNKDSIISPEPLRIDDYIDAQNNPTYYFNKMSTSFDRGEYNIEDSLWFYSNITGTTTTVYGIENNVIHPITGDKYVWKISLQVLDKNNKILSEDFVEINWKNSITVN